MFVVYRMRKKDEGSYALDEPKRSPTVNSYSKPPSRESGNGVGFQNHGHPGVYDRNGRDVYYDRQNKSYPIGLIM